jgi:hypothetical protein
MRSQIGNRAPFQLFLLKISQVLANFSQKILDGSKRIAEIVL